MKSMRPRAFTEAVGQEWLDDKIEKFPKQGWASVAKDNVIYAWFKPSVNIMDLARIERTSGKQVNICPVPKSIIKGI